MESACTRRTSHYPGRFGKQVGSGESSTPSPRISMAVQHLPGRYNRRLPTLRLVKPGVLALIISLRLKPVPVPRGLALPLFFVWG